MQGSAQGYYSQCVLARSNCGLGAMRFRAWGVSFSRVQDGPFAGESVHGYKDWGHLAETLRLKAPVPMPPPSGTAEETLVSSRRRCVTPL